MTSKQSLKIAFWCPVDTALYVAVMVSITSWSKRKNTFAHPQERPG